MQAINFRKHFVTNGTTKARIAYSAFTMASTGEDCVTLYAKDCEEGRALAAIFGSDCQNNSDSRSDYFEAGLVRILKGTAHYEAAFAMCCGN